MVTKNMKELREQLCEEREALKTGKLDLPTSIELSNKAGKIINTVRTQLEKCKLNKEKVKIDFINCH